MPVIPRLVPRPSPGVYLNEDTFGSVPINLATHSAVYVLGTCTAAGFPYNTPVFISNYQDFLTQAISSPSAAAIELFFNQRSGSGLYFVRVPARQQSTLIASTFTPGTVLTFTISGNSVSYTCVTGDTALTATVKLGALINSTFTGTLSFYSDATTGYLRSPSGTAGISVSPSLSIGALVPGTTPKPYDVSDAVQYTFVPEHPQGYICAPEFYQAYTLQTERTALQLQLEAFAANPSYYWVSVVDMGSANSTTASLAVNNALAERATYVSTRGNSWVSFPYVKNLVGADVPSSLATIGVAMRRQRAEGFIQPPAGVSYPIYGITGTSINITSVMQDQLNPQGINCLRQLPARGTVCYGARTLSVNPFYKFAATRVILNVLAGTLERSFDSFLLSLVDGQGAMLGRVKTTAVNICELLRQAGGLYGDTPAQAYLVICDSTNNSLGALESGTVNLDVIVKPSPTLEALNITLSRAALSTVLAEIVGSGDTAAVAPTSK